MGPGTSLGDLFVPAVDEPVLFHPRHQLVKRRTGATDAVCGQRGSQRPAGLRVGTKHTEDKKLQVREHGQRRIRHNATLSTIGLDGVKRQMVRALESARANKRVVPDRGAGTATCR